MFDRACTGGVNKVKFRACLLALLLSGCASLQDVDMKVREIEQKHNVTVIAKCSRSFLAGDILGLLDSVDKGLEKCPRYFKDNIGPVIIEDSFNDAPKTGLLTTPYGYVWAGDYWDNFPIHIKNRNIIDRILTFNLSDEHLFVHEASHSFDFTIKAELTGEWHQFDSDFEAARAICNHRDLDRWEDFAEMHCYLYSQNIESLTDKYPSLYKKCGIVKRFTEGYFH